MLQRLGHIDQHAVCALPAVPLTTVIKTLPTGPTQYLEQRNTLGACCLTQYLEHGGLLPYTVP